MVATITIISDRDYPELAGTADEEEEHLVVCVEGGDEGGEGAGIAVR